MIMTFFHEKYILTRMLKIIQLPEIAKINIKYNILETVA